MTTILITLATIGGLIAAAVVVVHIAWCIVKSLYSTTGED